MRKAGASAASVVIDLSPLGAAHRERRREKFSITPLKGKYIDMMMKIAAEAASAQITSVRITVVLRGAKISKLTKMVTSHDVTTINRGIDIEVCSDWRYINQ